MLARVNPLATLDEAVAACMVGHPAERRLIARMFPQHWLSISGGKDSQAVLALAVAQEIANVHGVFADAGIESLVSQASKRAQATFFHHSDGYEAGRIDQMVEWAKTSRGGVQYDIFFVQPGDPTGCSSSYGLCEQGGVE